MTNSGLITAAGLSVGYSRQVLVGNINISVRAGEIVTLIGANGTGKTTILKSIIRQLKTLAGVVYIKGTDTRELDRRELARTMSVLMTGRLKTELMTCREVVETGRYPYTGQLGILSERDHEAVFDAMKRVCVDSIAHKDFNRISDGQRQRVMLARAVCQEPEILVLDEPTSFLDVRHKLELLQLLKELAREKKIAVLMSLHELDLAQRISDYVVCIRGNQVDRCGTPAQIFREDYIPYLYQMSVGSFNPFYGSVELPGNSGNPEVFLIAGNGSGCQKFRGLQRAGIPFAVGILYENDIDYPAAKALSSHVIVADAFEPMGEELFEEAKIVVDSCRRVICCLEQFGTLNDMNRRLMEYALRKGYLKEEPYRGADKEAELCLESSFGMC